MSEEDRYVEEPPLADPKFEQAVFGREVRFFLQNDRIGRWIVNRAAQEVQDQLLLLKDAAPEDATAIRTIQTKIRVAESVVEWLLEAVDDGDRATEVLEGEEG